MSKKERRINSGFAVLEGLLVFVIIGMLAGIGWYVKSASDSTNKTLGQTNNSSVKPNKVVKTADGSSSLTDPESTSRPATYITIKEWGVKIAIRNTDKVSYKFVKEEGSLPSGDKYDSYVVPIVDPKYLVKKDCEVSVGLQRLISTTDSNLKKVGGYYYESTGSPYSCGNNQDDSLFKQIRQDFTNPDYISAL